MRNQMDLKRKTLTYIKKTQLFKKIKKQLKSLIFLHFHEDISYFHNLKYK